MNETVRRTSRWAAAALVGVVASCGRSADAVVDDAPLRVVDVPALLPDPCRLVGADSIEALIAPGAVGVGETGPDRADDPLVYRTCRWGDLDSGPAIGLQIGAPNRNGHDVVANRADVLEPSSVAVGFPAGRETSNLALMPTGSAMGASLVFQAGGYHVIVAGFGGEIRMGEIEDIGREILDRLTNG